MYIYKIIKRPFWEVGYVLGNLGTWVLGNMAGYLGTYLGIWELGY